MTETKKITWAQWLAQLQNVWPTDKQLSKSKKLIP